MRMRWNERGGIEIRKQERKVQQAQLHLKHYLQIKKCNEEMSFQRNEAQCSFVNTDVMEKSGEYNFT